MVGCLPENGAICPWRLNRFDSQIVEKDYSGPVRISGSAGTGKTIVALHRAVHLARKHSDTRVLLTTFSDTLANALRVKLRRLIQNEPRLAERLEVHAIDAVRKRLYEAQHGTIKIADDGQIRQLLNEAASHVTKFKFTVRFLIGEWNDVVDAWQLKNWEAYRDVIRLGHKTRLPEKQRAILWSIFQEVMINLQQQAYLTHSEMYSRLAEKIGERKYTPYDFVVVDEAQYPASEFIDDLNV